MAGPCSPVLRGRPAAVGFASPAPTPQSEIEIDANMMSDPADMDVRSRCVELCRELGNAQAFQPFVTGRVMPGPLKGEAMKQFIRDCRGDLLAPELHGQDGA